MKIIILVLSVLCSIPAAAQTALDTIALEVAHSELLFSHTSVVYGKNDAFVEFFDDSCIMLDPFPVNGKQRFKNIPRPQTILTWKPACVEISSGGDFAYSTGPWEIRRSKLSDAPVYFGNYFSIWRKTAKGWKVVFDHGIGYPKKEVREEKFRYVLPRMTQKIDSNTGNARDQMMSVENKFIAELMKGAFSSAYRQYAADNIRLVRNNKYPSTGKNEAVKQVGGSVKFIRYISFDSRISGAGDLGCTYGIAITSKNDTCNFVRVWRKEQEWKIAVDIL